jgi:uncharacterized protein YgiM (DUF1202 family)
MPTLTMTLPLPTPAGLPPTPTVSLPTEVPTEEPWPPDTGGIEVGRQARVTGAGKLNIREEANMHSKVLQVVTDTTKLTVLDGPVEGEGYAWWKVRSKKGTEGWVVGSYLEPVER